MRLDKLIHQHVNSIEKELDFSAVSDEELLELEALYIKAGSRWNGFQYVKPDFQTLSDDQRIRLHEISEKVQIKPVLKISR